MVRDLHAEETPTRTAVQEPEPAPKPPPATDGGAVAAPHADPSELFMKDDGNGKRRDRPRKQKNRKHGRPR